MKRFGSYMVSDDGMISAVNPRSPDLNDADYQAAREYADTLKSSPPDGVATRLPSSTIVPQPEATPEQDPVEAPTTINPILVKYLREKQANPALDASRGRVNALDAMNASRSMAPASADPYAQTLTRIKNQSDPYVNNGVNDEMHNARRQALQANLAKLFASSAAQIGTMGGKQADTKAFGETMDDIAKSNLDRGASSVSAWERGRANDMKLADLYKTLREKKMKDSEWVSPSGKPIFYDDEGNFSEAGVPAGSVPMPKPGSKQSAQWITIKGKNKTYLYNPVTKEKQEFDTSGNEVADSKWQKVGQGSGGRVIWQNFATGEKREFDVGYKPDSIKPDGTPGKPGSVSQADKMLDAQSKDYQNYLTGSIRQVVGKEKQRMTTAVHGKAIVGSDPTKWNELPPMVVAELGGVMAQQVTQGSPAESTLRSMTPHTMYTSMAKVFENLTGKPAAANSKEFVEMFAHMLDRQMQTSQKIIRSELGPGVARHYAQWGRKNPELFNSMTREAGLQLDDQGHITGYNPEYLEGIDAEKPAGSAPKPIKEMSDAELQAERDRLLKSLGGAK